MSFSFQYHSLITLYCTFFSDAEGQSYQIKEGCQNITALSCDLTSETPSVDDVHYWAQVWVNSHCLGVTNPKFKPIADSKNLHSCSYIFIVSSKPDITYCIIYSFFVVCVHSYFWPTHLDYIHNGVILACECQPALGAKRSLCCQHHHQQQK